MPRLIPLDWLPACTPGSIRRCIVHWSGGAGSVSPVDAEHYHILIDRVGQPHRGDHSIRDNLNTADDDYAAHTRGLNRGSIGLALCGMAGANEKPFAPGRFPLTRAQWNSGLLAAADLCERYGIAPARQSLLMHCEVEAFLNVKQASKWDIERLVFDRGTWGEVTPGEELRARVKLLLEG